MLVPALVLIAAALALGVVGALAAVHRLPRNRVLGVRTAWTMSSVDAFRRANRAAAPAFLAAGVVGAGAGLVTLASPTTAPAVTVLIVGTLGLVALTGVAGVVGMRFAEADEVEVRSAFAGPTTPCTAGAAPSEDPAEQTTDEACAPTGGAACGGACSLCPRAASGSGPAGD